jgi:hypothetical protein
VWTREERLMTDKIPVVAIVDVMRWITFYFKAIGSKR